MKRLLARSLLWFLLFVGAVIVEVLWIVPRFVLKLGTRGVLAIATFGALWSTGLLTPVRPLTEAFVGVLGPAIAPWVVVAAAAFVLTRGLRSPVRRGAWRRLRTRG
jgi:hypothetical protein